jgi:hypothetical protein
MILNPPEIVLILKSYHSMIRLGATGTVLEDMLAVVIKHHLGHQPYETFLKTYQLFLQSIPLETAKAAWGINSAASACTHTLHKTKP